MEGASADVERQREGLVWLRDSEWEANSDLNPSGARRVRELHPNLAGSCDSSGGRATLGLVGPNLGVMGVGPQNSSEIGTNFCK